MALLKEFQKVINCRDIRYIIENYSIEVSIIYCTFYKNIIQKTEKRTSKGIPQLHHGHEILIKFRHKSEDPVLFQLNLISEIILSVQIFNFTCDKSNQFFGRILSDCGLLNFKEKLFKICNEPDYYHIIGALHDLQFLCFFENENLYAQVEGDVFLLNDRIFYTIKTAYGELINKKTLNKTLKEAYYCIYDEFIDVIDKMDRGILTTDIDDSENKYIESCFSKINALLNTDSSYKLTPADDISALINFMANNDYNLLDNLIRIIKSIKSGKRYNRMGYLFYNCHKEIFSIYKLFFKKLHLNINTEISSTSELNEDKAILQLLRNKPYNIRPIFVNKVTNMNKNTSRRNLRNILSGKKYKVRLRGNLNDSGFEYGTFIYENDVPVLIYAENKVESKRISDDFIEHIYRLDFKNIVVSSEDFEKYEKIIENLNLLDIYILIYNILSLDSINEEDNANEPLLTDNEFIKDFIDKACKIDKVTVCTTDELFKAYQSYLYYEHNRAVGKNDKAPFSKKFKKIANIERKNTNKAKGYKGVRIIYENKLDEQQLKIINSENADKKEDKSKYAKTLDLITDFNITRFLNYEKATTNDIVNANITSPD